MSGHAFVVCGDQTVARETMYSALENQGFTVTKTDEWSARAERGSKGASIAFGALAGTKRRHVTFDITCTSDEQGNLIISLLEGTSGISGGIIGMDQAQSIYSDIYAAIGTTFQSAGVLVAAGPF